MGKDSGMSSKTRTERLLPWRKVCFRVLEIKIGNKTSISESQISQAVVEVNKSRLGQMKRGKAPVAFTCCPGSE